MARDFTYVDDIVEGIFRLIDQIPKREDQWDSNSPDPSTSSAPYKLYNIGNEKPIELMDFISAIEYKLQKKAKINFLPLQPGDVLVTNSDVSKLQNVIAYKPNYSLQEGVSNFVDWYQEHYIKI